MTVRILAMVLAGLCLSVTGGVDGQAPKPDLADHIALHAVFPGMPGGDEEIMIEELSYEIIYDLGDKPAMPMVMVKIKGYKKLADGTYSKESRLSYVSAPANFTLRMIDKRTGKLHGAPIRVGQPARE